MVKYKTCGDFPGYRVGDDGSLWSSRRKGDQWVRIAVKADQRGRFPVAIYNKEGARKRATSIPTLVLTAFVGPHKEDGQEWVVKHKNGNKTDNRLVNLAWAVRDRSGERRARGESHGMCRLTEKEVKKIKALLKTTKVPQTAKQLGHKEKTVRDIYDGRTWAWLEA